MGFLKRHKGKIGGAVIGLIAAEVILSVPPMELTMYEVTLDVPADSGGLVLDAQFLSNASEVQIAFGTPPTSVREPSSMSFDTRPAGACRSFQVVHSARDRRDPNVTPNITIRPRAPKGQTCTAMLDTKASSGERRIEVPADTKVALVLKGPPPDPLLVTESVSEIRGSAIDARGGLFALARNEVKTRQKVAVRGSDLKVHALSASNDDPDGALRVVLEVEGRSVPSATIGGTNLSLIHRLKIIMAVASKFH